MEGASQIDVRPNPLREGSVQVNEKFSPRRSFDQITTCRWASTRSSKDTASFESYVRVPITGEPTRGVRERSPLPRSEPT